MTHTKILSVAAAVLIFAGVGVRVWGLVDHSTRTSAPDDPIVDVMQQLRRDLAGAAVLLAEEDNSLEVPRGHLRYDEGPQADRAERGDTDDVLTMTVRADRGSPFTAAVPWGVLEACASAIAGT